MFARLAASVRRAAQRQEPLPVAKGTNLEPVFIEQYCSLFLKGSRA
jgi:hypothetical protein